MVIFYLLLLFLTKQLEKHLGCTFEAFSAAEQARNTSIM